MIAIWRKEVKSYFSGMSGYIIIAFLLAAVGFLFKYLNLQNGVPKFEYTLAQASILLLLFIPLLTMRSFSEERRQKTDLLLYSLPISLRQIILGKYTPSKKEMKLSTPQNWEQELMRLYS